MEFIAALSSVAFNLYVLKKIVSLKILTSGYMTFMHQNNVEMLQYSRCDVIIFQNQILPFLLKF